MVLKGFAGLELSKKVHMNENLMNLQEQCRLPKRKQTIYCGQLESGVRVINLPLAVEADGSPFQRFLSTTSCRSLRSGKREHPKKTNERVYFEFQSPSNILFGQNNMT